MPKHFTHAKCFATFGVKPKNPRWSWSGRSEDGTSVAVTLWQDKFENGGRTYKSWEDRSEDWKTSPGFVELIENLAHARDHLNGLVHVILAQAKDKNASPRSIARCFPHESLKMRVIELDQDKGSFVLERA